MCQSCDSHVFSHLILTTATMKWALLVPFHKRESGWQFGAAVPGTNLPEANRVCRDEADWKTGGLDNGQRQSRIPWNGVLLQDISQRRFQQVRKQCVGRWWLSPCALRQGEKPVQYESESEVAQSCLTLCNPMDYSLPGFSLHGILQARVLEWVAISFSRGAPQLRDRTWVSSIPGRRFNLWATRETLWVTNDVQFGGQRKSTLRSVLHLPPPPTLQGLLSEWLISPGAWGLLVPALLWLSRVRWGRAPFCSLGVDMRTPQSLWTPSAGASGLAMVCTLWVLGPAAFIFY